MCKTCHTLAYTSVTFDKDYSTLLYPFSVVKVSCKATDTKSGALSRAFPVQAKTVLADTVLAQTTILTDKLSERTTILEENLLYCTLYLRKLCWFNFRVDYKPLKVAIIWSNGSFQWTTCPALCA